MRHLYSALLFFLTPWVVLRMLWRSRRHPDYRRRLAERFGVYPEEVATSRPCIWLHAVSVGEVVSAAPLVERLLADYGTHRIVVTTTTPTGSDRVRALFGDRVEHVYCPWDLPFAVRRFLLWARPQLLLVMETELWPNLLYLSRAAACRSVLVNGRLSAKSAGGYARLPAFSRWLVGLFDVLLCQSLEDSKHFLSLGAPHNRVLVSGNLKWERQLDDLTRARGEHLRALSWAGEKPVLLAASTHPGEEAQVLAAYQRMLQDYPGGRLVLVPRHPERVPEVEALCRASGLGAARLSQGDDVLCNTQVVISDSIGEVPALYAVASVAFVGGSLVAVGGHNPVEPALWRAPIVSGPYLFNFNTMSSALLEGGGMRVVENGAGLGVAILELLADPARGAAMAEAAGQVLQSSRGALENVMEVIAGQLDATRQV